MKKMRIALAIAFAPMASAPAFAQTVPAVAPPAPAMTPQQVAARICHEALQQAAVVCTAEQRTRLVTLIERYRTEPVVTDMGVIQQRVQSFRTEMDAILAPSAPVAAPAADPRAVQTAQAWCGYYQERFAGTCTPEQLARITALLGHEFARPVQSSAEREQRRAALVVAIAEVFGVTPQELRNPAPRAVRTPAPVQGPSIQFAPLHVLRHPF